MRCKGLVVLLCAVLGVAFFIFHSKFAAAAREEAAHEIPQEEIPLDRPIEEIIKYLAPMNEFKIFRMQEVSSCSECHNEDLPPNPERRDLGEPHDAVPGKFVNHDSENRWCLDCHNTKNRDKLRLINGRLVDFKEYYRLCEQCHKRIYREWKMGVHGKRMGYWNGVKEYMHCAQCHDPHDPPFKPIEPMPVPRKPKDVRIITDTELTK